MIIGVPELMRGFTEDICRVAVSIESRGLTN